MNNRGWESLYWQSKIKFLSLAGIQHVDDSILNWICYPYTNQERDFSYLADVFVKATDLFYLRLIGSYEPTRVEAGIITSDISNAIKLLQPFVTAFTQALKNTIDGRKHRHMDLRWMKFSINEKIDGRVYSEKFSYPKLDDAHLAAASCLTHPTNRRTAFSLAKKTKTNIAAKSLQECDELRSAAVVQKTTYELTSLGRIMLTRSHWMTVWITQLLINQGIAEQSIIWGLTDDGEEVDLVVQFKNNVWIFELKDGDFESGHAHPFFYRKVKFKADKSIVIATGKVSAAAKKVFQDLSGKDMPYPICIEGLEKAEETLSKLISNATLDSVYSKCTEISKIMQMNLTPVFNKLFGKLFKEYKGTYETDHYSSRLF